MQFIRILLQPVNSGAPVDLGQYLLIFSQQQACPCKRGSSWEEYPKFCIWTGFCYLEASFLITTVTKPGVPA